MTLADIYMEQEGKEEEKIVGKQEVAENLLAKGFSVDEAAELTKLEQAEKEKMHQEIKE